MSEYLTYEDIISAVDEVEIKKLQEHLMKSFYDRAITEMYNPPLWCTILLMQHVPATTFTGIFRMVSTISCDKCGQPIPPRQRYNVVELSDTENGIPRLENWCNACTQEIEDTENWCAGCAKEIKG